MKHYGFTLARGDRRGFVLVDYKGEIYSLSRWSGQKTKALLAYLGSPEDLPSVEEAKATIAITMTHVLKGYI